jgi:MIP family channel proteins
MSRRSIRKTFRDDKKGINMSEEIRNEQAKRIVESPGDTGPIVTPRQAQAISANQARSEFSEQYVKPVVAELIGTFGFVFIGAGSIITNILTRGAVGLVGIAFATGLALAIMITIFAATSGGHINPAVTVGFLVTRRIAPLLGLLYIVAQLVGATLAGLLLRVMYPQALWQAALLGTPNLAPGVSFGLGVLIEAILTFFLLLAVFGTAVDPRAPKIGGFGIGLTVFVDILVGGPLTGAAMNPARTFGPALAGGFWQNDLVYWIGPIIGAVIAASIYEYVFLRPRQVGQAMTNSGRQKD